MVFNATFNNVSAIAWRSVLLVEETWVPTENNQGAVPGGDPPLKLENMIFWRRKIVIFHTKYPKHFRASLRSVHFFFSLPPLTSNPGSTPATDMSQVTDKLYDIMLYQVHLVWAGFELTMLVVIGTDCTGSWNPTTIRSRPRRSPLNIYNVNVDI